MKINRRFFLKETSVAALALSLPGCARDVFLTDRQTRQSAFESIREGDGTIMYFFDDDAMAHIEGFSRVPGPVKKIGPVLEPVSSDGRRASIFAGSSSLR